MFGLTSSRGASGTGSIVINKPVDTVFNFIAVDFFWKLPEMVAGSTRIGDAVVTTTTT